MMDAAAVDSELTHLDMFERSTGMNTPNLSAQRRDPSRGRLPKVEILEMKHDYMQLSLTDTDVSVVNALRRIVYAEVPTLAMDTVEIITNTSCLTDEFIAHRMGLIPLTSSTVDQFAMWRDCTCDDRAQACERCSVEFELEVSCPPEMHSVNVTQDDLKTRNPDVRPVEQPGEDPILLLKLGTNQTIKMRGVARKGFGKEHAKYCPVAVCVYQFEPDVRINAALASELNADQKQRFVKSCPREVFAIDSSINDALVVADPKACMYCQECTKEAASMQQPNLAFVGCKPGRFIFTIETLGQLTPAEVLMSALQVLKGKMQMMNDLLTHVQAQENMM